MRCAEDRLRRRAHTTRGAPYGSRATEKSSATMAPSAVSRGKSFRHASLAAKRARGWRHGLSRRTRRVRCARRSSRGPLRESPAAGVRRGRSRPCRCRSGWRRRPASSLQAPAARTSSAALVPRSRAPAATQRHCAAPGPWRPPAGRRTGDRRAAGWRCRDGARAQRFDRQHGFDEAARRSRWPIDHLNAVTGGSCAPNTDSSACASDTSEFGVPLRGDDHADIARLQARVGERVADRRASPAPSSRIGSSPRASPPCRRRAPRRAPGRRAPAPRPRSRAPGPPRLRPSGCRCATGRTAAVRPRRAVPTAW